MADGQVAVLENVRFNEGETSKDDAVRGAFADQLAGLRRPADGSIEQTGGRYPAL